MDLGDFTAGTHLTVGTEHLGKLLQGFQHAVRRLIEDHRTFLIGQRLQLRLAAFLLRQETLEAKAVARQSTADQSRHESSGARERLHLNAGLDSLAYQKEPWVTDAWRASIADERNGLSSQQPVNHRCRCTVLVELMV